VIDVALIVAGSTGMVEAALALGSQWQIAAPVLGVLILAPLTSIPNAITGIRLGRSHRGSALVGEAFNSNTINLAAGVVVPALFVSLAHPSSIARIDIGWLVVMTALALVLLARPSGMRRRGGMILICLYLGLVVVQTVSV
jgi:Ca2+/Na+ antiporter